jgi:hypothetical protein
MQKWQKLKLYNDILRFSEDMICVHPTNPHDEAVGLIKTQEASSKGDAFC